MRQMLGGLARRPDISMSREFSPSSSCIECPGAAELAAVFQPQDLLLLPSRKEHSPGTSDPSRSCTTLVQPVNSENELQQLSDATFTPPAQKCLRVPARESVDAASEVTAE